MEALASALLTGTESWVGADGKPFGLSLNQPVAGQLEIGLDVREATASTDFVRRYWITSLAPSELDDLGSFDYGALEAVFLGRNGLGPLRIGCDTNILVDILEYGARVLTRDPVFVRYGTETVLA